MALRRDLCHPTSGELSHYPPGAQTAPGKRSASVRVRGGVICLQPVPAAQRIAAVVVQPHGICSRQLAKRAGVSESRTNKWRARHLQQ